jgi:hypothetical protein
MISLASPLLISMLVPGKHFLLGIKKIWTLTQLTIFILAKTSKKGLILGYGMEFILKMQRNSKLLQRDSFLTNLRSVLSSLDTRLI